MIKKYCNENCELLNQRDDALILKKYNAIIQFLFDHESMRGVILDIGERNPLTEKIENCFKVKIDSSEGDLNYELMAPKNKYDLIICSHVIEHIPNVLTLLINMKSRLSDQGRIFLTWPVRLTKDPHHYHEISLVDTLVLINEVGLRSMDFKEIKMFGRCTGIRPFIRRWTDKDFLLILKH